MAISLGDAVMVFRGDTENLDAAFNKVPANAEKSFGAAAEFNKQFNDELDATGENVKFAGEKILSLTDAFRTLSVQGPERLKSKLDDAKNAFATLQAAGVNASGTMAQATQKVIEREIAYRQALGQSTSELEKQLALVSTQFRTLGNAVEAPLEKMTSGFHEARGAATLLSETAGIKLPRELRSLAAGLPGIGIALQAAFIPTAIFALIEVLISAQEKLEAFIDKPRKIEEAWRGVGDAFVTANKGITDSLDAAQAKIIGLTQGPIAQMDFEIRHLGSDAIEVAGKVGQIGDALTKALVEGQASKFNPMSWWGDTSRDAAKEATNFFHDLQSTITQMGNNAGIVSLKTKIVEVGQEIEKTNAALKKEAGGLGTSLYQDRITALQKFQQELIATQGLVQKGIELDKDNLQGKQLDESRLKGQLAAEQAKRDFDLQIASIDKWRASIEAAYASGNAKASDWALAQVRAANAADSAHENYLSHLIQIYTQSGDVIKAHATQEELNTLKISDAAKAQDSLAAATLKYNAEVLKTFTAWNNLQAVNVGKQFEAATKAAEELVKAENKLQEAQTKLAEAQVNRDFAKQIQGVQDLAEAGIISQGQMTEQLKAIYQQQEKDQLSHLQTLLDQQMQTAQIAQQQLTAAKDNPYFSDAQVLNLRKNLDEAETAIANTQTQIVNIQASNDSRLAGLDRTLIRQATASWQSYFKLIVTGSLSAGQALRAMSTLFINAIGSSVEAAVTGSQSFGQAMLSMLKSALATLAGEAVVEALKQLAKGFSALADPFTASLAPGYFLAAAKWGAVGAAAAIAGAAVPSGSSSGAGSSPSAPANLPPTPATTAGGAGAGPNVPRLYTGGLVSKRTLALIGDSRSGNAREGIIPLDDPAAMDAIAGAISSRLNRSSGAEQDYTRADIAAPSPPDWQDIIEKMFGGNKALSAGLIQNHYHIKGDVIDHSKLMKAQSRLVKKGRARQTASTALQLTKRA